MRLRNQGDLNFEMTEFDRWLEVLFSSQNLPNLAWNSHFYLYYGLGTESTTHAAVVVHTKQPILTILGLSS